MRLSRVRPSVCLSVCLCVCLCVCVSVPLTDYSSSGMLLVGPAPREHDVDR